MLVRATSFYLFLFTKALYGTSILQYSIRSIH
jgi:hypothetical protein